MVEDDGEEMSGMEHEDDAESPPSDCSSEEMEREHASGGNGEAEGYVLFLNDGDDGEDDGDDVHHYHGGTSDDEGESAGAEVEIAEDALERMEREYESVLAEKSIERIAKELDEALERARQIPDGETRGPKGIQAEEAATNRGGVDTIEEAEETFSDEHIARIKEISSQFNIKAPAWADAVQAGSDLLKKMNQPPS